ncbi:MAG: PIN domain-containing protein [Nanoarchaeota archaeon]|nr:PIN domain-containing protein [Nanoarchaeota archaeon]MBU1988801.1 PIN domain-containing protein [Nanoarchaeota archaeon]
MTEYIFDTYAIIEIIRGNPNYKPYLDEGIIINDFIFSELCYNLIKIDYPKKEYYLEKYEEFISQVDPEIIKEAMQFSYKNKKKKMSMTDCVSYVMAKELEIKFLTGDKEFERLNNVEFVK